MKREIITINMPQEKADVFREYFNLNEMALDIYESEKSAEIRINDNTTALVILDASKYPVDELQRNIIKIRHSTLVPLLVIANEDVEANVLKAGADDCVHPDIDAHKLFAHAMAMIRRQFSYSSYYKGEKTEVVRQYGELAVDSFRHRVTIAEKEVHLTPNEFRLLNFFIQNPDRVLTQDQIGHAIWLSEDLSGCDSYRVVSELRRKLGDTKGEARYIHTVYGFGYKFTP